MPPAPAKRKRQAAAAAAGGNGVVAVAAGPAKKRRTKTVATSATQAHTPVAPDTPTAATPTAVGAADEGASDSEDEETDSAKKMASLRKCKEIAQGIKDGDLQLVDIKTVWPDRSFGVIWSSFRLVRHKDTGVLQPGAQCGRCKCILTYKERDSGCRSFTRHLKSAKCLKMAALETDAGDAGPCNQPVWADKVAPSPDDKKEMTKSVVEYCAWNLRPPVSVKDPGLVNLVQKGIDLGWRKGRLDAAKLLPCPTTIRTNMEAAAKKARHELAEEVRPLMEENRCSATCDCWTDDHRKDKYMVLTLHFIRDWKLYSRMLGTRTLPHGEASSATNLKALLQRMFEDSGLDASLMEKVKWVTDAGSDIKKALESFQWFYCMTHALNIVLRTALSVRYFDVIESAVRANPMASQIVTECNEWVQQVRTVYKKKKLPVGKLRLKASVPTTASHVRMLHSVERARAEVEQTLLADAPRLDVDMEDVADLADFLSPFDLSGSREASPQVSIGVYHDKIQPHLVASNDDSPMIVELKVAARKELEPMPVIELLERVKVLVAYLKRSGLINQLDHAANQEVQTRWNSHYGMLDSLCDQWEKVCEVMTNATDEAKPKMDGLVLEDMEELAAFLEPFQLHTDRLQGQAYPTLPYVEPAFEALLAHLSPDGHEDDTASIAAVRRNAYSLLMYKVVIRMEHKIARFLWPKMKHLKDYTNEERAEVHEAVRARCRSIEERRRLLVPATQQPQPPSPTPSTSNAEDADAAATTLSTSTASIKRRRKVKKTDQDLYGGMLLPPVPESEYKDEVQRYSEMSAQDIGDDSDLLQWWKTKGALSFPILAELVQEVLPTPGSSAPSERVCSDLGVLITDRRSSMLSSTVGNTLALRDHLKNKFPAGWAGLGSYNLWCGLLRALSLLGQQRRARKSQPFWRHCLTVPFVRNSSIQSSMRIEAETAKTYLGVQLKGPRGSEPGQTVVTQPINPMNFSDTVRSLDPCGIQMYWGTPQHLMRRVVSSQESNLVKIVSPIDISYFCKAGVYFPGLVLLHVAITHAEMALDEQSLSGVWISQCHLSVFIMTNYDELADTESAVCKTEWRRIKKAFLQNKARRRGVSGMGLDDKPPLYKHAELLGFLEGRAAAAGGASVSSLRRPSTASDSCSSTVSMAEEDFMLCEALSHPVLFEGVGEGVVLRDPTLPGPSHATYGPLPPPPRAKLPARVPAPPRAVLPPPPRAVLPPPPRAVLPPPPRAGLPAPPRAELTPPPRAVLTPPPRAGLPPPPRAEPSPAAQPQPREPPLKVVGVEEQPAPLPVALIFCDFLA
ncbi:Transposable element Hobo transposase [Frankliniella fusca]|uniref:Transposable element Hobo transposase n=1 Tax=Frankliniella fusca TaxID=407009 RepID=A0AAE1I301_9NEOP|nr:Transposable element Hobo transposase [Frankliniella fusca]